MPQTFLLDTQAILWYLERNPRLSATAEQIILSQACVVHIASFWEIGIKTSLQKLHLQYSIEQMINALHQQNIPIVPVSVAAIKILQTLPFHHKDPFDRLLIAEALQRSDTAIISIDEAFDAYGKEIRVWD